METKIYQRIGLVEGPNQDYTMWYQSFNAEDVFLQFMSFSETSFLKKIELVDLHLIVENTGSNTFIVFDGINPNSGFDVSGVYQTLIRSVSIQLPHDVVYNIRDYGYPSTDLWNDFYTRPLEFNRQIKIGNLLNYSIDVKVLPLLPTVLQNLQWETRQSDGLSDLSYMSVMYTIETINI